MKICTKCGVEKSESEFNNNSYHRGGYHPWCKECIRLRAKVREQIARRKLIEFLGGKCVCCGEHRFELLNLDHVFGKDNQVYKNMTLDPRRISTLLYARIRKGKGVEGFRILCWNCNCSRGIFGYCPHEKERELEQQTRQLISSCTPSEGVVIAARSSSIW